MSSTHCQREWQRIREPAHARCARRLRRLPVWASIGSTVVLQLPAITAEAPSIALIHTAGHEPFGGCWLRRPDEAGQTGGFAGAGAEMATESTPTVAGCWDKMCSHKRDSTLTPLSRQFICPYPARHPRRLVRESLSLWGRTTAPLRLSHLHLARLLSPPSILSTRPPNRVKSPFSRRTVTRRSSAP